MVHLAVSLLWASAPFFAAAPFWDAKEPKEWNEEDLRQMLSDSPWARTSGARIFLASARPIREAEEQMRLRHGRPRAPGELPHDAEEYELYLRENPGKHIILAARLPRPDSLMDASESRAMTEGSYMKAGGRKIKMIGHFLPTSSDPYVRFLFPRVDLSKIRSFSFELYLPSVDRPFRMVEFFLKEMKYKGSLEY